MKRIEIGGLNLINHREYCIFALQTQIYREEAMRKEGADMSIRVFLSVAVVLFVCAGAFAMCGVCGSGAENKAEDGVKKISYEQFMGIRNSGEKYTLLDVLSSESYNKGHIEGAESFQLDTINKTTV